MAVPTIDNAFITEFNRDLHLVYQRRASKLRGTVRTDGQVIGKEVRFQKLGTLNMVSKARNGEIPITNPAHSYVTAPMEDAYMRVVIDQLDLTKLNTDVRNGYLASMAAAAARKTDDIIINAMANGATVTVGDYGSTESPLIDRNMALMVNKKLDAADVPRDGRRFCVVTPHQWAALECIKQFVSADYNGPDLPFKKMGFETRTWNDVHWMVHSGLPGAETSQAKCYAWHMDAVGHGINADVSIQWQWKNELWGWDGAGALSMGAVVIDANGLVEIRVDDTAELPDECCPKTPPASS